MLIFCVQTNWVCPSGTQRYCKNDSDSRHWLWLESKHFVKNVTRVESPFFLTWLESSPSPHKSWLESSHWLESSYHCYHNRLLCCKDRGLQFYMHDIRDINANVPMDSVGDLLFQHTNSIFDIQWLKTTLRRPERSITPNRSGSRRQILFFFFEGLPFSHIRVASGIEMARAGFWAGRWGWTSGPLTIFLAVGLHRAATSRPLMLKNTKIFLSWKNHLVAIKVTETTWHCFAVTAFLRQICFSHMWALRQARLAGTRDDRIVDFHYLILTCFWQMISVSDPNPVLVEIILSVSENYPKVYCDA